MSATSTIQNYYCAICDRLGFFLKSISENSMVYFELVGSARCAAELSRMGRKKEARTLLIAANKLRAVRKLRA
jgi:hypothetical protein